MSADKPTAWNSTLAPGAPLERGSRLERKTPMKQTNRERKKKRREDGEVYGPHHRHVATLPCLIADREGHDCIGPVQSHHVKTVGAGGVDRANCVPLCYGAHSEVHASGLRTFEDRWEIDLDLEAGLVWQEAVG